MNKMTNPALISELISTRISHDIIGNIGAVANAVELLEEGDMDFLDDIKSILKVSSSVLAARLKFFRLAFGLCNANLQDLGGAARTTQDYLATIGNQNFPIKLAFNLSSPEFAKVALLGVMIAADTIIKGGLIRVEQQGNKLYIISESNSPLPAEKLRAQIEAVSSETEIDNAQFAPAAYLKEILKDSGYSLKMVDGVTFGIVIA